jgi:tetratricopeptide (TPR) repeat protein
MVAAIMGFRAALGFVALLAVTPLAFAEDSAVAAREHYEKGKTAFELGQFDEAIREYAEAYRLKADPAILYNLAQAHKLLQHNGEAVFFYKMYLSKRPNAPNRDEVLAKIDALQKLIEQQKQTSSMPPNQVKPLEEPKEPASAPAVQVTPAPASLVTAPAPQPPKPLYKQWWLWTAVGAVVAGAAVGATVALVPKNAPIPGNTDGNAQITFH